MRLQLDLEGLVIMIHQRLVTVRYMHLLSNTVADSSCSPDSDYAGAKMITSGPSGLPQHPSRRADKVVRRMTELCCAELGY